MGLLDMTPEQSGMLLNLGQGLLAASGPSRMPVSFGQALAGGIGQMQRGKQDYLQNQAMAEGIKIQQLHAAQFKQQTEKLAAIQALQGQFYKPASGTGDQSTGSQPGGDSGFDYKGYANALASVDPMAALSLSASLQKERPKIKDYKEVRGADGAVSYVGLDEYGGAVPTNQQAFIKPEVRDFGGTVGGIDPITGKVTTYGNKTQSPDSIASNRIAAGNLGIAQQRLALEKSQALPTATKGAPAGYRWNPDGSLSFVQGGPADPAHESNKPLTEAQGKATGFATRAKDASTILQSIGENGKVQPGLIKRAGESVPLIGEGIGTLLNGTQSDDQQQVDQAQRNFINAILRQESGAAISDGEFSNAKKQYFPQPGDSARVIQQKAQNRDDSIVALEVQAGTGLKKAAAAQSGNVRIGTVDSGFVYLGGDPGNKNSWKPVK